MHGLLYIIVFTYYLV